jgi:hypothetical protein
MTIFKNKNPAFSKFVALQLQIGIAHVNTDLSKSEPSLLVRISNNLMSSLCLLHSQNLGQLWLGYYAKNIQKYLYEEK